LKKEKRETDHDRPQDGEAKTRAAAGNIGAAREIWHHGAYT
jgi:hypothetical protein